MTRTRNISENESVLEIGCSTCSGSSGDSLNTVESVLWTPPPSYEINGPVVDMIKTFWTPSFSKCKKRKTFTSIYQKSQQQMHFLHQLCRVESLAANFQPPSADISVSISATSVTVGFGPVTQDSCQRGSHTEFQHCFRQCGAIVTHYCWPTPFQSGQLIS